MVDVLLPLRAGPERSVAATKSFLATCLAFLHLTAEWAQDEALCTALEKAPEALDAAGRCDWRSALLSWREARSLYVIGRGLSFGIAQEIALKFKETCRIHAEAFSAAEVLHGPLALVGTGFPALVLDPGDEEAKASPRPQPPSPRSAPICAMPAARPARERACPCRPACRPPCSRWRRSGPSTAPSRRSPKAAASTPTTRPTSPR